jgi:hypothetical protein
MATDEDTTISLRSVQAYAVQRTEDGTQMGLVLKVSSDLESFGFSNDEFARFAATVLKTTSTDPQLSSAARNESCPIELPGGKIFFESDDQSGTVTVAFRLGCLRLTLPIDGYEFFESLRTFMKTRRTSSLVDASSRQRRTERRRL